MKTTICLLCSTLLLTGCVYHTGALRSQVRSYAGDGVITDVSVGSPPFFWSPGFRIVLPAFDPAKPYEQSYNLKNVPKNSDKEVSMINVSFLGDWSMDLDQIKQKTTSNLSFEILDDTGAIVKSLTIPFNDKNTIWSWMQTSEGGEFGLWVHEEPCSEKNTFYFDPAKHYTLHITYIPGEVPPSANRIWITIKNGGTI
ncbi:MAG TPA: hypothetical protein VK815_18765 [Candidatus Acidoferrales bacterium]|jgi:hypothetical protein|nr:hypothetical protein [Candidatus Acidoferrales bacterium]